MGFAGCIPRFLKTNAGWVLTALGSAGLIGTVFLVGKETPAAQMELEEEQCHKLAGIHEEYRKSEGVSFDESYTLPDEWYDKADLTFWEKTKIVFPIYLPAILMGTGTLACFWGAQIFNARKQAALIAAYGTLAMQFDQYREAIKAEYGEEADKKALAVSKMEVKRLQKEIEKLKEENGPQLWEYASLPGVIFEERPENMYKTFMLFNRNILHRCYGTLHELYKATGIPSSCFNVNDSLEYGWSEYENEVSWGTPYVDFRVRKVKAKNGVEVNLVETFIPPFDVELDYGFEGSPTENLYPGYDPDKAEEYIRRIEPNGVVKLVEPDIEIVYF